MHAIISPLIGIRFSKLAIDFWIMPFFKRIGIYPGESLHNAPSIVRYFAMNSSIKLPFSSVLSSKTFSNNGNNWESYIFLPIPNAWESLDINSPKIASINLIRDALSLKDTSSLFSEY